MQRIAEGTILRYLDANTLSQAHNSAEIAPPPAVHFKLRKSEDIFIGDETWRIEAGVQESLQPF